MTDFLLSSPLLAAPACLASDYDRSGVAYQYAGNPAEAFTAAAAGGPGSAAAGAPVTVSHTRSGGHVPLFSDDWYWRIHISLTSLELGNIVDAQAYDVYVWNAWLDREMTLLSIDGVPEGVSVTGQPDPPLTYRPNQERLYTLGIPTDGPPTVNDVLTWDFDTETVSLALTASRIIAWPCSPDWSEPVTETLSWLTDVLQSDTLMEQRRALRAVPRLTLEARFIEEGASRQRLEMALHGWGGRVFAVPYWPDIQRLTVEALAGDMSVACVTEGYDFAAGGLALLRSEESAAAEVVAIQAVTAAGLTLQSGLNATWPAGSRLYPALSARLTAQPGFTRLGSRIQTGAATFQAVSPPDRAAALPDTTYQGYPVLEPGPNEAADLSLSNERLLKELDNDTGEIAVTDAADLPLPVIGWAWAAAGRAARNGFKALLYGLRGRQQAVWISGRMEDMTLTNVDEVAYDAFLIARIDYYRMWGSLPGRRDLRIAMTDGSVYYRRVANATLAATGDERITLDAALDVMPTTANVERVSFMTLCRLTDDEVELSHVTDAEGWAECELTFRGVRDEEAA